MTLTSKVLLVTLLKIISCIACPIGTEGKNLNLIEFQFQRKIVSEAVSVLFVTKFLLAVEGNNRLREKFFDDLTDRRFPCLLREIVLKLLRIIGLSAATSEDVKA